MNDPVWSKGVIDSNSMENLSMGYAEKQQILINCVFSLTLGQNPSLAKKWVCEQSCRAHKFIHPLFSQFDNFAQSLLL